MLALELTQEATCLFSLEYWPGTAVLLQMSGSLPFKAAIIVLTYVKHFIFLYPFICW